MQATKLLQLVLTGLLVASLPLASVWAARDGQRYRKLVGLILFLTFDLIVFGAFTRLTDSGLGCPDWPGCYGHANPLQALGEIHAAQNILPDGPVTWFKAWIEMLHRYLAMAIGILIIALVIAAWRLRKATPRPSLALPFALLFFVCLQGAFGAWTVTLKLQPIIVTTHLLLGMGLLALIAILHAKQTDASSTSAPTAATVPASGVRWLAPFALLFVFVQIALGGWVSTNYATLACTEFPMCQGAWLPNMDWQHGFSLWRELGKTSSGEYLPFPALTAIHWLHRNVAFAVALVVLWLAHKVKGQQPRLALLLQVLIVWQIAVGLATIYLQFPLALALAHNAGAALLVASLSVLNFRVRSSANA